jgi:hypothetical protein
MPAPIGLLATLFATPIAAAEPVVAHVQAGVGLPQFVHASVGWFPHARISLDLRYGNVVFNHEVGVGTTVYLLGTAGEHRPPRHALLAAGHLMMNPTLSPPTLSSGGDRLAAYVGIYSGYGFLADSGFQAQLLLGAFLYEDGGPAVGPDALLGIGWAF